MFYDRQEGEQNQVTAKMIINTEDIKFMVHRLQQEPFGENVSLVEFDDLNALELLEQLNRVLVKMDDQIHNVNVREELQQNTINRITEFLKVINFPVQENDQFSLGIVQGEKRVIYPILYYILSKWDELQTRAYLARYLVPLHIPEEILADMEVGEIHEQYKELQAEFQVTHQQLEGAQKDMMKPGELKKDIQRYEQEKEQLNSKINVFKNKNNNKPEFQRLLEVTNALRLQQEEEANIQEKIRNQKAQLEWTDQQLMISQQRLMDIKKSFSGESPEQMLGALRNEVRKNRDMAQERLGLEIGEKKKKVNQIEKLLREPSVTNQELNGLENQMVLLDKDVRQMSEKLRQQNPADDKLAIYKQQATLVTKKKEKLMADLKRLSDQQRKLEEEINVKDGELQKQRGPSYGKSNDDFKAYANSLKEKTVKFKKMKEELKNIQGEIGILNRTEQITRQRKEILDQQVQKMEKEKGILGYGQIKEENEMISEMKEQIDLQKTKKLEQITEIVGNIQKELGVKKDKLTKQVNQLKELKKEYGDLHGTTYTHKKNEYDQIMATINTENQKLEEDIQKLKDVVYKEDSRIERFEFEKQLYELKLSRLNDETNFTKGNGRLSQEHKCYKDLYKHKISSQELEIKQIKMQRDVIKENHEPSLRQMNMFNNLKKLLAIKISLAQNAKQPNQMGENNRLVL